MTEVDNPLDKSRTETKEDGHRKLFVTELGKLIGKAERHNAKKQHIPLVNCTNIIVYLAIYMKEFTLAVKVYSICAEMLMVQEHWIEAAGFFFKVACCVKTAGMSLHAKMYAYKQIAFCNIKTHDYHQALRVLYRLLEMALGSNS